MKKRTCRKQHMQNPEKPNLDDVPFDEENMDEASWEILLSPDLKRKLNEP